MPSDSELMEALIEAASDPRMRERLTAMAERLRSEPADEHCCLCGRAIDNVYELNNPWPLVGDGTPYCCPECNQSVVQARLWMHIASGKECDRLTAETEKRFKEIREKKKDVKV